MSLRFLRRKKLFHGISLNLSKGGPSVSVGRSGMNITAGKSGIHSSIGVPGTGVSFREKLKSNTKSRRKKEVSRRFRTESEPYPEIAESDESLDGIQTRDITVEAVTETSGFHSRKVRIGFPEIVGFAAGACGAAVGVFMGLMGHAMGIGGFLGIVLGAFAGSISGAIAGAIIGLVGGSILGLIATILTGTNYGDQGKVGGLWGGVVGGIAAGVVAGIMPQTTAIDSSAVVGAILVFGIGGMLGAVGGRYGAD